MAPAQSGVAERLIEPARLRPKRSMPPNWRGGEMTGTREPGLPCQHPPGPGERTAKRPPITESKELTPNNNNSGE